MSFGNAQMLDGPTCIMSSEDVGSLDCPDCQLQLLQQQQSQNQSQNPPPSSSPPPPPQSALSSQSTGGGGGVHHDIPLVGGVGRPPPPPEIGFPLMTKSASYSQVEPSNPHHHPYHQLSTMHPNLRAPVVSSGCGGLNVYHYGTDYGSLSVNPSTSNSSSSMSHGTYPPANPSAPSVPPTHSHHHGAELNYGSSGVMEPCDYHGYCSTCAVIDLPSNDKYYHRPANPRPHVFPPIFYSQGPSSVIPGFSSVGDWTNGEYGHHYAYSATFSQTAPSVSVGPSVTSDIYGAASSTSSHHNGNNHHGMSNTCHHPVPSSFEMFNSNQSAYPNQRHHIQPSTSMFATSRGTDNASTSTGQTEYTSHSNFLSHITTSESSLPASAASETVPLNRSSHPVGTIANDESLIGQKSAVVPCSSETVAVSSPLPARTNSVQSPADKSHQNQNSDSGSESSCDSDSDNSSIASEDRELISVVEDDDEEGDETESTKGVRPGGKCFVCHNPIDITDCSSPQLAKILENIEDDIAVEDLDISGDIEIGGIEDYHGYKKRNASGGSIRPSGSGILTTSRLSILLGFSTKNGIGLEPGTSGGTDNHDVAILCFRCGKLASMADTLERQLASTIQTLNQQLMTNNSMEISPRPPSLNANMEKSVSLEDYQHSVPSISPALQFHHIRPLHHKGIQTELESRSWGTQVSIPISNPITSIDIPQETVDAMTQCCSNDFSETISFEETSSNQTPSSSINNSDSNNEESSTNSSDGSESESEEADFDIVSNNDSFQLTNNILSKTNEMMEKTASDESTTEPQNCSTHGTQTSCPKTLSEDIIPPQNPLPDDTTSTPTVEQVSNEAKFSPPNPHDYISVVYDVTDCIKNNNDCTDGNDQPIILASIQNQINLPNACDSCHKVFSTKSNLRAHIRICKARLDNEEQGVLKNLLKCVKCGVGFRNVLRHRVHIEQGCKDLNFACDHCPRKFAKSSELKVHRNSHKGEKPFSCEKCGASFTTKGNQIAHSKTHLENKRFHCCQCDKGFNRRFALTIHLNRHNDVKPFPCNICNKSFPDPSYLTRHKKKAHVLETMA